jgi:hypothetical protein
MIDKTYYWVAAVTSLTGQLVVLGPYDTEEEANQVGFEKVGGTFSVEPLRTKDVGRATRVLKYKRFHQTANLEEALKRAKHT